MDRTGRGPEDEVLERELFGVHSNSEVVSPFELQVLG
jgi:hypothetical protein